MGLPLRTMQRWEAANGGGDRRLDRQFAPANKLTPEEEAALLEVLNSKTYRDLPPDQVVVHLADAGRYLASPSTCYRLLRRKKLLTHRLRSKKPKPRPRPRTFKAKGPNEVWTWDITYLPTQVRGVFLYLYMVIDIFSRKIVGHAIHDAQCANHAAALIKDSYHLSECKKPLVLHADNGTPMKGSSMLAALRTLGIMPSFSRPAVSNDNAFSEALFRTLKYRPNYPGRPFVDAADARDWVNKFVYWYNFKHLHSALNYVTPQQRHTGQDRAILRKRAEVYRQACRANPQRWARLPKSWKRTACVTLNPVKSLTKADQGRHKPRPDKSASNSPGRSEPK